MVQEHPEVLTALEALSGKISAAEMRRMNHAVDGEGQDVAQVVRDFLRTLAGR
jgi:osmoprotectant transport system permease protein